MSLSKNKLIPFFLLTFFLYFGFCITAHAETNPFGTAEEQKNDLGTLVINQTTKYENNQSVANIKLPINNEHYYKLTIQIETSSNNYTINESKLVYTPDTRFIGKPVTEYSYKYSDTQLFTDLNKYINKPYTATFKGENQPFITFKATGRNDNHPSFQFKIYLKDYGAFRYGTELNTTNSPADEITLSSSNSVKTCFYYFPQSYLQPTVDDNLAIRPIFSNDTFNHYINVPEEGKIIISPATNAYIASATLYDANNLNNEISKASYLDGYSWDIKPGRYFLKSSTRPSPFASHNSILEFASSTIRFQLNKTDRKIDETNKPNKNNNDTKPTTSLTAPSAVKVKTSKKSMTITFKKNKNATGYQVQYAKNNKFTKAKSKKVKTNKVTIKKLKKGKYFIRIRAFKKKKGKTTYSKWSTKKSVTVK